LRTFTGQIGVLTEGVDGSAVYTVGNTQVLATVSGPREALERAALADSTDQVGILSVRFHAAAFSSTGGERRRSSRHDRRLLEWARLLEEAFSAAVLLDTLPRSEIDIFVEVLNADGAVLSAAINAVTLALLEAGIPMRDYVVAGTAALVQGTALLDANRMEEGAAPSVSVAVLARRQQVVLLTAEPRVAGDRLKGLMDLAIRGCGRVFEQLDAQVVRPWMHQTFLAKHGK
jgi:exosome complex component RRP41